MTRTKMRKNDKHIPLLIKIGWLLTINTQKKGNSMLSRGETEEVLTLKTLKHIAEEAKIIAAIIPKVKKQVMEMIRVAQKLRIIPRKIKGMLIIMGKKITQEMQAISSHIILDRFKSNRRISSSHQITATLHPPGLPTMENNKTLTILQMVSHLQGEPQTMELLRLREILSTADQHPRLEEEPTKEGEAIRVNLTVEGQEGVHAEDPNLVNNINQGALFNNRSSHHRLH